MSEKPQATLPSSLRPQSAARIADAKEAKSSVKIPIKMLNFKIKPKKNKPKIQFY